MPLTHRAQGCLTEYATHSEWLAAHMAIEGWRLAMCPEENDELCFKPACPGKMHIAEEGESLSRSGIVRWECNKCKLSVWQYIDGPWEGYSVPEEDMK